MRLMLKGAVMSGFGPPINLAKIEYYLFVLHHDTVLRSQPFQGYAGVQFNFTALGFTFSPADQAEWHPSADLVRNDGLEPPASCL